MDGWRLLSLSRAVRGEKEMVILRVLAWKAGAGELMGCSLGAEVGLRLTTTALYDKIMIELFTDVINFSFAGFFFFWSIFLF